uniref:Predicted F0F1-type ATP synthase gamma subunit n=1 Tax=uncultured bacterium eBACred22E04 TaxID=334274 RepID=Q4PJ45_9BACT|nr:predicted F0F1-type ATP synthase gamma subunit [uncultured bacterium eBACred22E04]
MDMAAASKSKKAQVPMNKPRVSADKIVNVIIHLAHGHPEYTSYFFYQRKVFKKGYIIKISARGLFGGLNNKQNK